MTEQTPDAEWARLHGARFELQPLIEMIKGRPVQVGLTVILYARFPIKEEEGSRRRTLAGEIQARLREIALTLSPGEGSTARVEVQPPRAAAILSADSAMEPEVSVEARVFHAGDYTKEATRDERDKAASIVRRQLAGAGVMEGRRRG